MDNCTHRYNKFNDEQLYCENCGEFKLAPKPRKKKAETPTIISGCGHCHGYCNHHYSYPYYVYPNWTWTSLPTVTYTGMSTTTATLSGGSTTSF